MKSYKGFKIGDFISPKVAEPAYYSGYGGRPVKDFEPDEAGRIAAIVPKVKRQKYSRESYFFMVYFVGKDERVWQAGVDIKNALKCPKGFRPYMVVEVGFSSTI